jgi:DNA repair protein RecO (recombination protein O)
MIGRPLNGVVLRLNRFAETSLIVTWLSQEEGKIKTAARGARRPASPFAGKLDLFHWCELLVLPTKRSEIQTLKETRVIEDFAGIRRSYANTLAAAYFAECVDETTELEHPVPEIFELLVRAYRYLNETGVDAAAVTFFEAELGQLLGIGGESRRLTAASLQSHLGRALETHEELLRVVR